MLENYLVQTCEIISTTRNRSGDYVVDEATEEPCRFREITTTRRESHSEVLDSDALIWLRTDTTATLRGVIKFDGTYYQVERINRARKLGSNIVEFVKCDLKVINLAIS